MGKEKILKKLGEIERLDDKIIDVKAKLSKIESTKKYHRQVCKIQEEQEEKDEWESTETILCRICPRYKKLYEEKDILDQQAMNLEEELWGAKRGDIVTASSFIKGILNILKEVVD